MTRCEAITYRKDAPEIKSLCDSDARLSLLIRHYGDLSYTLHPDPFAHTIENIVGQMLSSKAANAITTRLYALCGGELTPTAIEPFDMPALRGIGLSKLKAEYIVQMAELLRDEPDYFDNLEHLPDGEVIKKLTALRGLGMWSAKMYLIFVLNRLDVLPFEDGAFLQTYKWLYATDDIRPAMIKQKCAPWSPFSSIAARYMYRALDYGMMRDASLNEKLAGVDS